MRVMVVRPGPSFSVQDVCNGWVRALRNAGVEVLDLNLDDRLDFYTQVQIAQLDGTLNRAVSPENAVRLAAQSILVEAYRFWPDVIIVVSGFFVPIDMYAVLRDRGHHVVMLLTESPYEDDKQLDLAALVDTVLVNDPTNLDQFRALNSRTWYLPHAYDPEVHHPGPGCAELAADFSFVGTFFESRVEFFDQVDWPTDDVILAGNCELIPPGSPLFRHVRLHAHDECLDNATTAAVYRSAKASANFYRRESQRPELAAGWAMGPREVELAACGTFFLRDPRPEGDELFPMLPTFESPAEFSEKLAWWLANDSARESAAVRARAAVEHLTFDSNARWLLDKVATSARV